MGLSDLIAELPVNEATESNLKVTPNDDFVPMGTDMEYLDSLTLEMALENRSEVS